MDLRRVRRVVGAVRPALLAVARRRCRRAPSTSRSPTRRRSSRCGWRRCASARGSCRPTRWARRRSWPGTSTAPAPTVGFCAVGPGRRRTARGGRRRCRVVEVDEADADLDAVRRRTRIDDVAGAGATRPGRGDVHVGHDRSPKGVEITQANYAFAGATMAAAAGLQARAPPARRAAAVPRQRAVLQLRLGDLGRRVGGADAHVLGERLPRARPRRHGATHASLFAAPIRMILARGDRPAARRRSSQHCWYADEHHRRPARRRSPRCSAAGRASCTG